MKYVVFQYKQLFMSVIFPDHITHSQIKIDDAVPVSAGFCKIGALSVTVSSEGSTSLNLMPNKERDEKLLFKAYVLGMSNTAAYLTFDNE